MNFGFDYRRPEAVLGAAVFLLFLYGLWLRVYGVAGFPLWNDELWRALQMSSARPLIGDGNATALSAPGYLLAGRWLSHISNSELSLKITSIVPGALSIPLAASIGWLMTRRVVPPLIFALFIALNPELIRYSRELKPYASEVCAHLLLLGLFVRALHTKRPLDVLWLNAVAAILPLFALAIVFALPAVYCMSWVLLRGAPRPAAYRLAGLQFVGCALTVLLYWFNWRFAPVADIRASFFAEHFFDATRQASYLSWLGAQLRDISVFGLTLAGAWPLHGLRLLVWLALAALTAAALIRARYLDWRVVAYILGVLGAVLVVNAAGKWPFGAFRVNLFLIPYVVALLGLLYGVFAPIQSRLVRAVVLIVFVAPWLRGFHVLSTGEIERLNPPDQDLPSVMRRVCDDRLLENATVVVYGATYGAFKYYTVYHDALANSCGRAIRKLARVAYVPYLVRDATWYKPGDEEIQSLAQVATTANRLIVLFAHEDPEEVQAVEEFFKGKRALALRYAASGGGSLALVYDAPR